jgi:hypothetical protein
MRGCDNLLIDSGDAHHFEGAELKKSSPWMNCRSSMLLNRETRHTMRPEKHRRRQTNQTSTDNKYFRLAHDPSLIQAGMHSDRSVQYPIICATAVAQRTGARMLYVQVQSISCAVFALMIVVVFQISELVFQNYEIAVEGFR